MTGKESFAFDEWMDENKDDKKRLVRGWHALMVVLCACDDKGALLFNMDQYEDVKSKNKDVLERVAKAAIDINKLGSSDMEDEAKNLKGKASNVSAIG